MSKSLFGTDGVRGVANSELTPELALAVGRAAGAYAGAGSRVLLGWDPRLSSGMLKSAVGAGFCSSGCNVVEADVIPTGVLAMFVKWDAYALGAMVSASHNPAEDNGIKLLGPNGRKLPDAVEAEVERILASGGPARAAPDVVGRVAPAEALHERHRDFLLREFPARLAGMRIVVDCGHGAAAGWAGPALTAKGAEVIAIGASPDGLNINAEGGATKPATVQKAVIEMKAGIGMAFDGDADRVVFADENGKLVNGDVVMALWALERKRRGLLAPPIVVGTVMSNMGLERMLAAEGIRLERAPVGDRYVVERMDETGALIGGEQSGHIIFSELAPTGDGILTAVELLSILAETGRPLSDAATLFDPWPQVLVNVKLRKREDWRSEPVKEAIAEAEAVLGADGRLNVRASGTQPILRVMCEHRERRIRDEAVALVLAALENGAGGTIHSKVELTDALGD
jgi:phosphoglucosamine mutase